MKKRINKQAPPPHLSPAAARWWQAIVAEYAIRDDAGLLLLETAMRAFDRMREAGELIAKEGAVLRDRFDQPKPHPAVVIERDARSGMLNSLKALNLDVEPLRDGPGRPTR